MPLPPRSDLCTLNAQATTLQRLQRLQPLRQGGEASIMTGSMAFSIWNGLISLLSTHGARKKSSVTQLSLLLPQLSPGDLSGPSTGFMFAHASCPVAGNSMKKRIRPGIARSTRKKLAAIARLQSNFIHTQTSFWAITRAHTITKLAPAISLTCRCWALPGNKLDLC
jgi:hypothetical protein